MPNELTTTYEDKKSYLASNNFEHYYRVANMMSKSEMVPKAYKDKPQDILLAMELGRTWNLGPLQAIQNIAVINGKPSVYGDALLAICSSHPEFEDMLEEPMMENGATIGYVCTVKRRGRSPVTQSFTIEQAAKAGLWGKPGPWKSYPERMLKMRARGFALRDSFADALGGVNMVEDTRDYEIKDISHHQPIKLEGNTQTERAKALLKGGKPNAAMDNEAMAQGAVNPVDTSSQPGAQQYRVGDGEYQAAASADASPSAEVAAEVPAITSAQKDKIEILIEEKALTDDRLAKALQYYSVGAIDEMSHEKADKFIMQLEKM